MDDSIKRLFDSLTDEQKEKMKACKSAEELLRFTSDAGSALSDDMLEGVAGGIGFGVCSTEAAGICHDDQI